MEAVSVIEELHENALLLEDASNKAEHGHSEAELAVNSQVSNLSKTCTILQQENQQLR